MEFTVTLSNGNEVKFRKFSNAKNEVRLQMVDRKADNVGIAIEELQDESDVLDTIWNDTNYKKDLCIEILNHFKKLV